MCQDTILERRGPGSMPLSGVAPLYIGVARFDGGHCPLPIGQLARVNLELSQALVPQSCPSEVSASGKWIVFLAGSFV